MLSTGQSGGPEVSWLFVKGCQHGETVVHRSQERKLFILYINCTVNERDAGGGRVSLKLMVQLGAAEEILVSKMAASPRGWSRRSVDHLAKKDFFFRMGWCRVPTSAPLWSLCT